MIRMLGKGQSKLSSNMFTREMIKKTLDGHVSGGAALLCKSLETLVNILRSQP
jgi:hypothetical protein